LIKKKVILIPKTTPYTSELITKLKQRKVKVKGLKSFHYSTPYNLIVLVLYRFLGYKTIHIHWSFVFPFTFIEKLFFYITKKLHYTVVYTVHGIKNFKKPDKANFERSKLIYENSDILLIHCKKTIDMVEKLYALDISNKSIEIFHPLFNQYANGSNKKDCREFLNLPKDKKILLLFGYLNYYKNIPLFVELLQRLGNDYIGLIVGRPERGTANKLRDYEKNNSNIKVFLGEIPDDLLCLYFNASDISVLPYRDITTSGVLLTAYHFKKPAIVVDRGCIYKYMIVGKTGYTFKQNNINDLYNKTIKLLQSNYDSMGESANEFANQNFSWNDLIDKHIKYY